jgi:hypothetical protein
MDLRAATRLGALLIPSMAFAGPAFGAEVSGTVTIDGRPFVGTLTLPDATRVDIRNGEYRIFVPAGVYAVVLDNGRRFTETIKSSTIPVSQNINLDSQR